MPDALILSSEAVIPEDAPDRSSSGNALTIHQELGACDMVHGALFPDGLLVNCGGVLVEYERKAASWVYDYDRGTWVFLKK